MFSGAATCSPMPVNSLTNLQHIFLCCNMNSNIVACPPMLLQIHLTWKHDHQSPLQIFREHTSTTCWSILQHTSDEYRQLSMLHRINKCIDMVSDAARNAIGNIKIMPHYRSVQHHRTLFGFKLECEIILSDRSRRYNVPLNSLNRSIRQLIDGEIGASRRRYDSVRSRLNLQRRVRCECQCSAERRLDQLTVWRYCY